MSWIRRYLDLPPSAMKRRVWKKYVRRHRRILGQTLKQIRGAHYYYRLVVVGWEHEQ